MPFAHTRTGFRSSRAVRRGLLCVLVASLLAGCQQKMAVQPSHRPDEASEFFSDGRADRPLVPGTVARGHLRTDLHLFTGQRTRSRRIWAYPTVVAGTAGGNVLGSLAAA